MHIKNNTHSLTILALFGLSLLVSSPVARAQVAAPTPTATAASATAKPATVVKKPAPNVSPAPSATPSASELTPNTREVAIHETTTKLRERLQKILGDQDENADGKMQKAAYIGEVTRVSDEAITLKTLVGSEIIPIESSTILLKRTQRIQIADVTIGNWLIVIGTREKNGAIRPEVLLVQTGDLKPREHSASIGVVTEITATSVTMIPRGKTDPITFSVNKNSKLIDASGEKITLKALPKDVTVITVGFATENGWELGTLKTMMSMAEFKSAATPTPKPTLAPRKATPKPSPSPTATP